MIGLVEVSLIALAVGAYRKAGKKGVLTVEREKIYLDALQNCTVPTKLQSLAEAFDAAGLPIHAKMLRARAGLRGMSDAVAKRRREVFDDAMKSNNPIAIERVALAFESQTATGAAKALRDRAAFVRAEKTKLDNANPPAKAPSEMT